MVEDCRELINPAIVDGQIRGGVAQGIGAVLLERSTYDEDGQFRSSTLLDYLLPTATDVPPIEIVHLHGAPGYCGRLTHDGRCARGQVPTVVGGQGESRQGPTRFR